MFDTVDPLVKLSGHKAKFDVSNVANGKFVQPNPLVWNEKNISRWFHDSPSNAGLSESWKFSFYHLSCPEIGVARQNGTRPDLLLKLSKWDGKADCAFDQMLSISICEDLIALDVNACRECVESLIEFVKPMFVAQLLSRWIYRKNVYTTQTLENGFPSGTMIDNWREISHPTEHIFDLQDGAKFQVCNARKIDSADDLAEFFQSADWDLTSLTLDLSP